MPTPGDYAVRAVGWWRNLPERTRQLALLGLEITASRVLAPTFGSSLYVTSVKFDTGFQLGLIAFTAAVLGGIGNLTGAVLGAILIGLIQAFNEGLSWHTPGSSWTQSLIFSILILVLVFRPQGLLGEEVPDRA